MPCRSHTGTALQARAAGACLLAMALLFQPCARASPGRPTVHHDLEVRLVPAESRLIASDAITLPEGAAWPPEFHLNPGVEVSDVRAGGRRVGHLFRDGRLRVLDDGAGRPADGRVSIRYQGVFDDPVPRMPANTDNPGYGVTGTIGEEGTFLLAGAGWYPALPGGRATFDVTVSAPEGVVAVTAGSLVKRENASGATVCAWSAAQPLDGLSLSAGRYVVREKRAGRHTAMTFMLPETDPLAAGYLDAVLGYLADFEALFGPYPFEKFAVVENFFPTGYGFPSYTLLGSQVIRLPFIIRTSLGHEIAHCWWGNGVYVDYRQGNWCEGLTTYVSDYRFKALASPAEAREARGQMLRNYADLVDAAGDFPLSRFESRYDPASRTVGYDKGAMVFHMLRLAVGDEAFWQSLRDVFRERLFEAVSWDDLRLAFEARSGRDLDLFFRQWVHRGGAPRLGLQEVTAAFLDGGWRVTGRVVQDPPAYDLQLALRLEGGGVSRDARVEASAPETRFELVSAHPPRRLSLDPDFDVFRRLYPEEIPPSVNSLKGAGSVAVIVAGGLPESLEKTADLLSRSLGLKRYRVAGEERIEAQAMEANDVLLIGWPPARLPPPALPEGVRLGRDAFQLNGRVYDRPGDAFFGVFAHPLAPDRILAVFLPLGGADPETAARKITHYGKYSYLAFSRGENRDKGTWPPESSPLVHEFAPPAVPAAPRN